MRNYKGFVTPLFVAFCIALMIAGLLFLMDYRYTKRFFSSYYEDVIMTIRLDEMGSELLAILNAGDSETNNMEFLGASTKKEPEEKTNELEETLNNIRDVMKGNYNIEVIFPWGKSKNGIKIYGPEAPEKTDLMEAEVPLPCSSEGKCRGKVRLRKWQ